MDTTTIIRILHDLEGKALQDYRVKIKAVFGSLVRGEVKAGSDIDVLVEFEEGANLLHFVGLSQFLEDSLHVPVDVVPMDALRNELREEVLREAVYL